MQSTQTLTEREWSVLYLAALGLTDRMISETLGISRETAKRHMQAIFWKTGLLNRIELVKELSKSACTSQHHLTHPARHSCR